ncbi:MAG: protease modulator HflK N-terminal domain-containing protein, partial [Steroidobacteraceae bacterium]
MPWNDDPGRKDDPWQRKPEQGPPDLDQVIRDLQRRLKMLFGGGRSSGGGGDGASGGGGLPGGAMGVPYLLGGL